jgi:hypothetical protein
VQLKNLDLKTLQLFALIHTHRNLSRAADALDLTQPAVVGFGCISATPCS